MTAQDDPAEPYQFNLVDEPWIPCLTTEGRRTEMSLREALLQAHHIADITDASPLITAALYRLLLAVVYRVHGPATRQAWRDLWQASVFGPAMADYLERWRHRFDLFDAQHPFYGVAGLDRAYGGPAAGLLHELATGNNVTLFDHTTLDNSRTLRLSEAACALVACQGYALGGTISLEKGAPKEDKYADSAPLARGAVAVAHGQTLYQTLLLNTDQYLPPEPGEEDDQPAWERDAPVRPADRYPTGYIDLLTWQSRRISLFPTRTPDGQTVVDHVAIMKGYQFPAGYQRNDEERMVAFRANKKAVVGQDPFPPVGFQPERAVWRDSLALLQLADGSARPKTLNWLHQVDLDKLIAPRRAVPLDLFGLRADKASMLFWRHERLPLPLAYLDADKKELFSALATGLQLAEKGSWAVRESGKDLARLLLAPESDQQGHRTPPEAEVARLAEGMGMERAYWMRLEPSFKRFLVELADDIQDDGSYGGLEVRGRWAGDLRDAALDAFRTATSSLASSPRSFKAVARAEGRHAGRVVGVLSAWLRQPDGVATQIAGGDRA